MKIKVTNPYYDKEYEVIQSKRYIENAIKNCQLGNEAFISLTTVNEFPLLINPSNIASMEILESEE